MQREQRFNKDIDAKRLKDARRIKTSIQHTSLLGMVLFLNIIPLNLTFAQL